MFYFALRALNHVINSSTDHVHSIKQGVDCIARLSVRIGTDILALQLYSEINFSIQIGAYELPKAPSAAHKLRIQIITERK